MRSNPLCLSAIGAFLLCLGLNRSSADVITSWNLNTDNAIEMGGVGTAPGSRIGAIEAIAVYDAVNSIRRFGSSYHYYSPPGAPASAQAAAAQAAHDVLVHYFPSQQSALDVALATSLNNISDGPIGQGPAVGAAAAADIIALRANDGSSPDYSDPGPAKPGIGQWRPAPPGFGSGVDAQWGSVKPFLMAATNQFRPGPPPAVGSAAYSNAMAQVQAVGSVNSVTRTGDQTHIAQFYQQNPALTVNEAARELAAAAALPLEEEALTFLLTDVAVADATIALWDAKYTYLWWRPVTALNANPDGSVTNGYRAWTPLLATPADPDYPEGHGGMVNGGFEVLKSIFGDWNTLQLHTTTVGEQPRVIQSLSIGEMENGMSRIYGGVHCAFDKTAGQAIGDQVAAWVLANGPTQTLGSMTNATSQLSLGSYAGITVTGVAGQAYRIDYATTLTPSPNWATLKYVTLPTSLPFLVLDTTQPMNGTNRFYRATAISNP